jgi:hypothetical protein
MARAEVEVEVEVDDALLDMESALKVSDGAVVLAVGRFAGVAGF